MKRIGWGLIGLTIMSVVDWVILVRKWTRADEQADERAHPEFW
jgi:hypothetical protein